ncbi:MAG: alpha/beta fold hydrolase [Clostridia bacterium]|nr:alpha/beta fold hydrolase [Clostridia bacterium]
MKKESISFPSSDGIHTLSGVLYRPEGEIKGIFHALHGMNEYTVRYEALLEEMAREGYAAFAYDHLGHGHTAKDRSELGFIAEKDGWRHLVLDVGVAGRTVRNRLGEDLPYVLFGHSMGSFIARLAVTEGVCPQKLILMGTAGKNPLAPLGIILADLISAFCGKRHVSPLMKKLVFGNYDHRFPGDYRNRWLTVDTQNLLRYRDDPYCIFSFSVSALGDLIRLHHRANSRACFRRTPAHLSVLLLSGKEDPVGDYGKGVRWVHEALVKNGKKSRYRLFEGYRHEILLDFCKDEVIAEIRAFLSEPWAEASKSDPS